MTIQRKYSLPNCTLLLEGLSDATTDASLSDVRPLMTILVNAECDFTASGQRLTGGRDFFESLVAAVTGYAQEFLSKVHHPEAHKNEPGLVHLHKADNNRHRLLVKTETKEQGLNVDSTSARSGVEPPHGNGSPFQIDLTTVQLFDLVEAVDQFFADSQTLPDLTLQLSSVSKRYTADSSQALVKQAVPATVGMSSLALAAIAFFLVPIPEVERPREPSPQSNYGSNASSTLGTQTPASDLEAALATAPKITDPSQLNVLNQKLYNQLNQAWKTRSTLKQDLVYRVGVAADGAIVGYKAVNPVANEQISQTPLPNLLENPAGRSAATQEPLAQFKVLFTDNGELQVSPW